MEVKKLTVEQMIIAHLEENGQKSNWLAEKIGCTPSHLHFVLKGKKDKKRDLSKDNLAIINQVLKTNF